MIYKDLTYTQFNTQLKLLKDDDILLNKQNLSFDPTQYYFYDSIKINDIFVKLDILS